MENAVEDKNCHPYKSFRLRNRFAGNFFFFFFKIEIFSDHKLYDLGYLVMKKQFKIFLRCGFIANFLFLPDGLLDTLKVLNCQRPLDLLEILARE